MKALTIWQPWASLIMAGAKPYEFRGWRFPSRMIGQRVVCHAGVRPMKEAEIVDLIRRLGGAEAWSTALRWEEALPVLSLALHDVRRPKPISRINASATLFERMSEAQAPLNLPLGCGLGTFVLGEPKPGDVVAAEFGGPSVNDSDRDQHANWGWPCESLELWDNPVPCKGAQGFWEWPTAEAFAGRL